MYPFDAPPDGYIQQSLTPQQGFTPMPQMTPQSYGGGFHGPAHQMLHGALQASLAHSLGVPGLLAAMQSNPALAQQIGGLLSPQHPVMPGLAGSSPYRVDWFPPAAGLAAMAGGGVAPSSYYDNMAAGPSLNGIAGSDGTDGSSGVGGNADAGGGTAP